MVEKELFIKALNTLFFTWGGDTPPDVVWAANDLLDWFEKEYKTKISERFEEDCSNYDKIIEEIQKI